MEKVLRVRGEVAFASANSLLQEQEAHAEYGAPSKAQVKIGKQRGGCETTLSKCLIGTLTDE
jgi:hypothetical protein